jgi:hypothetical protein
MTTPAPLDRCRRCTRTHDVHALEGGRFVCPDSRGKWTFQPLTAEALGFVDRVEGGPGRASIRQSHRGEGFNHVD